MPNALRTAGATFFGSPTAGATTLGTPTPGALSRETRPTHWLRNALQDQRTAKPMPNAQCPMPHAPLPITHYPLPITHYPIPNSQILKIFLTARISSYIKLLTLISH
jgi:hypothetical protein